MDAVASQIDRPFGLPPEIVHVVDIPCPPSVNRIWRTSGKKVYRSQEYLAWICQADFSLMTGGVGKSLLARQRTIQGEFIAIIELKRPRANADLDNRAKCVLDWAQRVRLISNDKHAVEITLRWSNSAPLGCRLTLRSVGDQPPQIDSWQSIGAAAGRVAAKARP